MIRSRPPTPTCEDSWCHPNVEARRRHGQWLISRRTRVILAAAAEPRAIADLQYSLHAPIPVRRGASSSSPSAQVHACNQCRRIRWWRWDSNFYAPRFPHLPERPSVPVAAGSRTRRCLQVPRRCRQLPAARDQCRDQSDRPRAEAIIHPTPPHRSVARPSCPRRWIVCGLVDATTLGASEIERTD